MLGGQFQSHVGRACARFLSFQKGPTSGQISGDLVEHQACAISQVILLGRYERRASRTRTTKDEKMPNESPNNLFGEDAGHDGHDTNDVDMFPSTVSAHSLHPLVFQVTHIASPFAHPFGSLLKTGTPRFFGASFHSTSTRCASSAWPSNGRAESPR